MQLKQQQGLSVLYVLLGLCVVLILGIWFKLSQDKKRSEQIFLEQRQRALQDDERRRNSVTSVYLQRPKIEDQAIDAKTPIVDGLVQNATEQKQSNAAQEAQLTDKKREADIQPAEERAKQEAAIAIQALRESEGQLAEKKREADKQLAKERVKQDAAVALKALQGIYAKWNDAAKLAKSTSRITLSGPVGKLQEIKREAEALPVSDCLIEPKKKLTTGMDIIIDGLLKFMQDAQLGALWADLRFKEAAPLLAEYEGTAARCAE